MSEKTQEKTAAANSEFVNQVSSFFPNTITEIDPGLVRAIAEDDPRLDHTKNPKMKAEFENLYENIKINGQIEPGLVYPMPDGKYVVIAGLQRLKAVRALKRDGSKPHIKYLARVADPKLVHVDQLIVACATNAARVAQTPLQEAYWIVQLLNSNGGNASEVARRVGVDEKTVRNARTLITGATPSMQKAIEIGAIKPTTALNIIASTKNDEKQQVAKAEAAIKAFEEQDAPKDKKKGEPAQKKAISGAELEGRTPSHAKLRRVIAAKGTPPQVANVLQWVVGDISTEALKTASPWFLKVDSELAAEDKAKADEAAKKAAQKEAEAKERHAAKMKREAEKAAKKEEEAKLTPEERKKRKLEAQLAKLSSEGKTASSMAAKPKDKPKK